MDREARRRWEASQVLSSAPSSEPYRILVPEHAGEIVDAEPDQIPAPAASVATKAREAGAQVRVTYSLCEALNGEAGLLRVIVVRVRMPGGERGWASWHNGYHDAAQWWSGTGWPRPVGVREFAALASDQLYEPPTPRAAPPVGPCPRCGKAVRWKLNPSPAPYAHTRSAQSDDSGQKRPIKEKCE